MDGGGIYHSLYLSKEIFNLMAPGGGRAHIFKVMAFCRLSTHYTYGHIYHKNWTQFFLRKGECMRLRKENIGNVWMALKWNGSGRYN